MFRYKPANQSSTLIHTWTTKYGNVNLIHDGKELRISINNNHQEIFISLDTIKGLPVAIIEAESKILASYLKNTYLQITLSEDNYNIQIQQRMMGGGNTINPGKEKSKLWAKGIIPFEIDNQKYPVGETERAVILKAIEEWNESDTGFRLIPHTDEADYLVFGEEDGVCYSNVGRQGGRQYIRCDLDGGGFNKRSVKHEIGHAVGLYHEHQRMDRDKFVHFRKGGKAADYAKKGSSYGDYDFNSIMHYHFDGSSLLVEKAGTITSGAELVGTQDRLSSGDIAALNYLASHAPSSHAHASSFASSAASSQGMFAPEHERLAKRGERAMRTEDYSQARKYFAALCNEYKDVINPAKVADWYNCYGHCAYQQSDYQQAKVGFENALVFNPRLEVAQNNLRLTNRILQSQTNVSPCILL